MVRYLNGDIFILYTMKLAQVEYLTDVELTVVRNISDSMTNLCLT